MVSTKISVIVPVYNAEKYLNKCIDSILSQTFDDFELLIIDDGSTDNSGKICDNFSQKDARIRVFHRENAGVSAVRDFGIYSANGDYVLFVDSDDWIEPTMLSEMYTQAIDTNSEIVGCNFYEERAYSSTVVNAFHKDREDFLRCVLSNYWGVVWKILVKRDLYVANQIHFPKKINGGEDYVVCVNLLFYANKVTCIDKALYHYIRTNADSIMSNQSVLKTNDQIEATRLVDNFLASKGLTDAYKHELLLRKFKSKDDLIKLDYSAWLNIFPEASGVWRNLNLGFKRKIYYWCAENRFTPFVILFNKLK